MTPVTRAQIEQQLIQLYGDNMGRVGMDVSSSGSNSYLNLPLRDACVIVGIIPQNPMVVADADLTSLWGGQLTRFIVICRWKLVEMIIQSWSRARLVTQKDLALVQEDQGKSLQEQKGYMILKETRSYLEREFMELGREVAKPNPMPNAPVFQRIVTGQGRGRARGYGSGAGWGCGWGNGGYYGGGW